MGYRNPRKRFALWNVSWAATLLGLATLANLNVASAEEPSLEPIEVAFLELRNFRGDLIVLEPRFPYAHMAISWQGGWLHAHPAKGVEWVSWNDLQRYGRIAHVTTITGRHQFNHQLAADALGKPYDHQFSWTDQAYYCSELVAKLLGIKPIPMTFDPTYWPPDYQNLNGLPGISPRLVYLKLVEEAVRQDEVQLKP